jgi:hypothetical protein
MAVTEMGLSPQKFWALTWYDWGLFVIRQYKEEKRRFDDREFIMSIERIKIADFKNANFRKKDGKPLNLDPEDIWRLSFDEEKKKKKEKKRMSPEEVEKKFGKVGKK